MCRIICILNELYLCIHIMHREDENPSQKNTKIIAGKKQLNNVINKTPYSYTIVDDEQPQPSSCNEIERLQREVAELKKQLESKQLQS